MAAPLALAQTAVRELHHQFFECTYCECQNSETSDVTLLPGPLFVKLRIENWDPTSHTGYPAWLVYNGLARNRINWTGWTESLVDASDRRVEALRGKLTPENPRPHDVVLFEAEYRVNEPIDVKIRMSSQNWHDGSGACHQTSSEHWLTVASNPSVLPSMPQRGSPARAGAAPVRGDLQVGGQWQEADGACRNTRWQITQGGEVVSAMAAQITCDNGFQGQWRADNIRWTASNVLTYTIHLSTGAVETHVTTFTAPGAATVDVYPQGRTTKSATVHLRKADAAPTTTTSAAPQVAGSWREVDGDCMGTTWAIAQQGASVTSMSAQITCNNGYRASWRGEGFRWASAAALTYTIHLSNGAVETHVTTFTAPDAATVEVYPAGQSRKSATVHLRRQ